MLKRLLKYTGSIVLAALFLQGHAQSVTNPILAGFYPDPSICRAGNNYYLVNSTFAYYPGLPVFHSRDLLNWELIGHAMERPEQLDLEGAGVSRGLFAPAISYHNGLFYIVCTEVSKLGNFVITAKDPAGPWSNPVKLPQVNGIDPSLFFDEDGKAYLVYNSIPPDNKPLHDGHRTIRIRGFDPVSLQVTGEEQIIVNGGTDMTKKPVWIEGPHIYKKDGWYILMCAEGGTGYNHSEVVFRSRSVGGPYTPWEKNPILTQRQLDPGRKDPVTTTGHADLVQDPQGNWWGIFLGCRPYEGDYYNTGRETFMAPVIWKEGWPVFDLGGESVKYQYSIAAEIKKTGNEFNGNYTFRDDFNSGSLNPRYSFLRTVKEKWYQLADPPGALTIKVRPETCSGTSNPSFVGFRQPHLEGSVSLALQFDPAHAKEQAGLLLFQNEKHYYFLSQSVQEGMPVVQLWKSDSLVKELRVKKKKGANLYLKAVAKGSTYDFYVAVKPGQWKTLATGLDGKFLSTKTAGGFVGTFYAMYASSNGQSSGKTARFEWFECVNDDAVYKNSGQ